MKKIYFTFLVFLGITFNNFIQAQCPTFSISAPSGTLLGCNPNTLTLTAINTSTMPSVTYTWTTPSASTVTGTNYTCTTPGIYTVDAKDASFACIFTQTISISQNTVAPTITVTSSSGTVTCTNSICCFTATASPSLSISGIWLDPLGSLIGPLNNVLPLCVNYPGVYTVTVANITNGCWANQTVSIFTNTTTPTISITGTPTVCLGTSTNFTASGAVTYTWSTGATLNTVNVLPTVTTTYSLSATGANGCVGNNTVTVSVNNTCSDVWPGDANSDGVANTLDILEIGLHISQSGPPRAITSNSYVSYFSNNWTGTVTTGKNLCHSDCNGDGFISLQDTLAVNLNFLQTHAFKPLYIEVVNPDLSIIPNQANIVAGTWGTSNINLGSIGTPINGIYGLAFEINFDNSLIQTDSVYLEYPSSFLNAGSPNIKFRKEIFANSTVYAASVRTNTANVTGFGNIAILHYKAKASIATNTVLNLGILNAQRINNLGIFAGLTVGTGTVNISPAAGIKEENELAKNIYLYPQPAKDILNIAFANFNESLISLSVFDITGKELINKESAVINGNVTLSTSELSSGVYILKITNGNNQTVSKRLIITK